MHLQNSRVEFYRVQNISVHLLQMHLQNSRVVLHSGVLQNPKYLSTSQSVLVQGGAVYNTRQPLSNLNQTRHLPDINSERVCVDLLQHLDCVVPSIAKHGLVNSAFFLFLVTTAPIVWSWYTILLIYWSINMRATHF